MRKLLLVDDSVEICQIMSSVFSEMKDFEFNFVHSYTELEAFDFHSIQFVLLDINLGHDQPSGLDCYRLLNEHHFTGKIIFFTGHASSHPLVQEANKIQNVSILSKPASIEEIENVLNLND